MEGGGAQAAADGVSLELPLLLAITKSEFAIPPVLVYEEGESGKGGG
jgi:hypothetical protein